VPQVASLVIIEDDPRVRSALTRALEQRGHVVLGAETGMAGLQLIVKERPEVIILDLGLPDVDGVDLLKMIRPISDAVVIAATARVGEEDIIATLDAGADDYLCKPFSPEQLDARIRASLRRFGMHTGTAPAEIVAGELRINARTRVATLAGVVLELSRKEFDVLHLLAQRVGQVVSKREMLAEVWRQPFYTTDKTVDVHISWLRRKLGETAEAPRYIHSVRGVGIKLVVPSSDPVSVEENLGDQEPARDASPDPASSDHASLNRLSDTPSAIASVEPSSVDPSSADD
jgi:two-component system, OmpR family, KDP operon response regulator KdpE